MQITRVKYIGNDKRKYKIIHEGQEYTCYICPCQSALNCVCTGNGMTEKSWDITDTKLGIEIMENCYKCKE